MDNIGSTALFPMCLSPLALNEYYGDFVKAGEDPVRLIFHLSFRSQLFHYCISNSGFTFIQQLMTISGYQWLSVCVALLVIPSTQMTPYCFKKLGVAGTCVFGNLATAVVTGLLLLIGTAPSTELTFGLFVTVMCKKCTRCVLLKFYCFSLTPIVLDHCTQYRRRIVSSSFVMLSL